METMRLQNGITVFRDRADSWADGTAITFTIPANTAKSYMDIKFWSMVGGGSSDSGFYSTSREVLLNGVNMLQSTESDVDSWLLLLNGGYAVHPITVNKTLVAGVDYNPCIENVITISIATVSPSQMTWFNRDLSIICH